MTATAAFAPSDTALSDPGARLGRVVHGGELGGFRAISDVAACLIPLLNAIGWTGNPRAVAEALPHFADTLDIEGLRGVLANLNYTSRAVRVRLADLDWRLLPCLFLPDEGAAMVVLEPVSEGFAVFDGGSGKTATVVGDALDGTAYLISPADGADEGQQTDPQAGAWSASVARRFRNLIWQMFGITFVISLMALAVPLFIMALYDRVIPGRSVETLVYLVAGVLFALSIDAALRLIRTRILAYIGGRIDVILGVHAFRQVLHLPVAMTERAPIGAQISRLRQFEAVREFFTGPLAGVFLELPFVILFIAVIAAIAGPLAWIPIILIAVFALCAAILVPIMQRAVTASGNARARRQSFLVEMLSNLRTVKNCSAEPVWSQRHRELSARSALANFRSAQMSGAAQTLAQLLMFGAAITTLTYGTMRVLDGDLTVGALIASMALIWRVLSPLQMAFLSLMRFEQIRLGLRQMNLLMKMKLERQPGRVVDRHRTFKGEIAFNRVSLRYTPQGEPALLGAEFKVEPGQILAITGTNGSGKSTVLRLVAGLYRAQAGAVLVDGIDIRQLDCAELRHSVAYVPQACDLFHGSIAQNLRLANPTASDSALAQAALDAGLMDDIVALPEGFETRLTDRLQRQLPSGFKQRLMLARAYVKDAVVYLLDEPGKNLDNEGDHELMRKLQGLRGHATVMIVTQRPSHMRLADRIIYLDGGRVLLDGPPSEVLPKMSMT
jgi:ATP-binding cassette subfamily C protein/ATP-binding cassette subfamily C protein LapB